MWFDSNVQHTCSDCMFGSIAEKNRRCEKCIEMCCMSGKSYSEWVQYVPPGEIVREFLQAFCVVR